MTRGRSVFLKKGRSDQSGPKCPIGAEVVGAEVVGAEVVGAEVSKIPTITPPLLMLGAQVSFHEGPKCLDEGPKCLFQKKGRSVQSGPKCPIGAELVGAEVVEAEMSNPPPPHHHPPAVTPPDNGTCKRNCNPFVSPCYKCVQ